MIRPCFFYCTLPNFDFDAMLKLTGIEIGSVYDQEMYEMIEAGLRGGMTQTTCKKIQTNNSHMGTDYGKKENNYINYSLWMQTTYIYIYIWFKHDTNNTM